MFSVEERDHVRDRLLALAASDPAVAAAAIIGSHAAGESDRWSDIDLTFAVCAGVETVLAAWTERLYQDFDAVHHWDLWSGSTVYRVFLLPDWLEADLSFTPEAEFAPRGPHWQTVFGRVAVPSATASDVAAATASPSDDLAGLAWHHVWHAKTSIERQRRWQAEYWIGEVRALVIAMACRRLGLPAGYAKGAHLLPPELASSLEPTLVCSLADAELRRALAAVASVLGAELERTDPELSAKLVPMLGELHGVS